ncbi:FAS1-like dehydratase domain-containing protein [Naumannella huperziae]
MISAEHVGRSYPPGDPTPVSAGRIAAFADAIGDPDPAYRGADAAAPPTFVMSVAADAWRAMFDDPELGLSLARTVHADQRFHWSRPLRAGDTIAPQLTITSVRTRGATETIGIRVVISTVAVEGGPAEPAGEEICTAESTFVHNREAAA